MDNRVTHWQVFCICNHTKLYLFAQYSAMHWIILKGFFNHNFNFDFLHAACSQYFFFAITICNYWFSNLKKYQNNHYLTFCGIWFAPTLVRSIGSDNYNWGSSIDDILYYYVIWTENGSTLPEANTQRQEGKHPMIKVLQGCILQQGCQPENGKNPRILTKKR